MVNGAPWRKSWSKHALIVCTATRKRREWPESECQLGSRNHRHHDDSSQRPSGICDEISVAGVKIMRAYANSSAWSGDSFSLVASTHNAYVTPRFRLLSTGWATWRRHARLASIPLLSHGGPPDCDVVRVAAIWSVGVLAAGCWCS